MFESKKELDYARLRADTLIENDQVARLLYRGVENKIKLEELKHMPGRKARSSMMR